MTSFYVSLFLILVTVTFLRAEEDKKEPLKYTRPTVGEYASFAEPFHNIEEFEARWVHSQAKKEGVEESIAKYDGKWIIAEPKNTPLLGDKGLILSSEAKHAAVSSSLQTPFKFEDKPLFVQYEVRFQNKHECGGAYVKLLAETPSLKLSEFTDKTEYTIMFGPDKCGGDAKLHFIFQHQSPITNKMEEKHAKKPSGDFSNIFDDGKTHLVTLIVRPDNSFEILVDKKRVNEGSLLKDMEPPVNPPKEIDDPEDKKPDDWDEREKILDPDATKPDDWDEDAPKNILDSNAVKPADWLDNESENIPDPAAVKPADWDEEEDGEWEAPQIENPKCKSAGCGEWKPPVIKNPAYKGKWSAPLISNPKYKGIWKPRKIENPNYFEDLNPFSMKPIAAVGFELWSMQSDILFDNVIIADDQSIIDQWTVQTWDIKHGEEGKSEPGALSGMWNQFKETTEEKPWLWVVVACLILLPFILIYVFCCGSSKKDRVTARRKKTDEVQPDDVQPDDVQPDDEEEEGAEESDRAATEDESAGEKESTEPKIVDVTEEEDKKAENSEEKETKTSDAEEEETSKVDSQNEDEASAQASPSPRTRSRRKARKDN